VEQAPQTFQTTKTLQSRLLQLELLAQQVPQDLLERQALQGQRV
jgi:hypothetical protein